MLVSVSYNQNMIQFEDVNGRIIVAHFSRIVLNGGRGGYWVNIGEDRPICISKETFKEINKRFGFSVPEDN